MGPVNKNHHAAPAAAEIYHSAHHHPLQLSHNHNTQIPCSACTHPTSTPSYGCQHCNYYLHVSCSKMPPQLQHPFDTNNTHIFKLFHKPVYPEGLFNCDACAHQGSGFSYHCGDCQIDLHLLCATLPSLVSVPGHEHQLTLMFAPPYADKKFSCDVCSMQGSKTWLYRCGSCQFDAHLGCIGGTTQQNKVPVRSVSYPLPNVNGYTHGHPVMGQPAQYHTQPPVYRAGPNISNAIAEGVMGGLAEVVAQGLGTMAITAVVGGFGGGGVGEAAGAESLGAME